MSGVQLLLRSEVTDMLARAVSTSLEMRIQWTCYYANIAYTGFKALIGKKIYFFEVE